MRVTVDPEEDGLPPHRKLFDSSNLVVASRRTRHPRNSPPWANDVPDFGTFWSTESSPSKTLWTLYSGDNSEKIYLNLSRSKLPGGRSGINKDGGGRQILFSAMRRRVRLCDGGLSSCRIRKPWATERNRHHRQASATFRPISPSYH